MSTPSRPPSSVSSGARRAPAASSTPSSARPPSRPSSANNLMNSQPAASLRSSAAPSTPSAASAPASVDSDDDSTSPPPFRKKVSAASHYADLASVPIDDSDSVPTEVECYENQRLFPIVGWSKNLLPTDRPAWSDCDGSHQRQFNDFKNPPGWSWTGEWTIDKRGTDAEGWQYAADFNGEGDKKDKVASSVWSGAAEKASNHKVRRRRWFRTRKNNGNIRLPDNNNKTVMLPSKGMGAANEGNSASSADIAPLAAKSAAAGIARKGNSISVPAPAEEKSVTPAAASSEPKPANPAAAPSSSPAPASSSSAPVLSSFYIRPSGPNTLSNSTQKRQITPSIIFEYQRYYPIIGWSDKLLPSDKGHWIDGSGAKTAGKEEEKLEKGWKWISDWEVVKPGSAEKKGDAKENKEAAETAAPEVDADGWQYGHDYNGPFQPKKSFDSFLRRRKWRRMKEKVQTQENEKKRFIQIVFQRLEALKNDLKAEESGKQVVSLTSVPGINLNA